MLGNGDGTFQPAINGLTGETPNNLAIGDFNEDANLDVATANEGEDTISILLGNGNGTFSTNTSYSTGSEPTGVYVSDFNNDGLSDFVTATVSGKLYVYTNTGMGLFLEFSTATGRRLFNLCMWRRLQFRFQY